MKVFRIDNPVNMNIFQSSKDLLTCLLRDDILRRSYSDNDSRNLAHNDSGDTDVRKLDLGIPDGRRTRRSRDRKSCFLEKKKTIISLSGDKRI